MTVYINCQRNISVWHVLIHTGRPVPVPTGTGGLGAGAIVAIVLCLIAVIVAAVITVLVLAYYCVVLRGTFAALC